MATLTVVVGHISGVFVAVAGVVGAVVVADVVVVVASKNVVVAAVAATMVVAADVNDIVAAATPQAKESRTISWTHLRTLDPSQVHQQLLFLLLL